MSQPSFNFESAAQQRAMDRDWRFLCETIGERRAGTPAEDRAGRFVVDRLTEAGLKNVRLEPFPCTSLRSAAADVHARSGSRWSRVEASPLVGAPATPGKKAIEADIVWLELPEESGRLRPGSLRGRILAVFGPLPTELSTHRRLLAAEPLAVIHVDERLPFTWVKNDGVYPYWAKHHGMLPTLTVPYADAWRWRRDGISRLRVRVTVDQVAAQSHNAIAELPGSDSSLPAIVISGHHDTQCGNPGADDNASGVVCLLALARALSPLRPRRTVRFLSFGTEEQLSVGSAAHVRLHRTTSSDTGLVINFDSVASPLGHFVLWVAGEEALARHATRRLAAKNLSVQVRREINPFADEFPFNRVGVPSLSFLRPNFPGGRWQHHSRHDTLENISLEPVVRLLSAVGPLAAALAVRQVWPFPSTLPAAQRQAAQRLGRELLGP